MNNGPFTDEFPHLAMLGRWFARWVLALVMAIAASLITRAIGGVDWLAGWFAGDEAINAAKLALAKARGASQ